MFVNEKKVSILIIVVVMFMVSCVMPSIAMAETAKQNTNEEFVDIDVTKTTGEQISLDDVTIQNGNKKAEQTRSQGVLTEEVFPGTSTLTSNDPEHIWIIDADTSRYLLMRMTSTNANYKLKLCVVDWNAGVINPLPTTYSVNEIAYLQLPAGSYAFYLYSTGTVGQTYDFTYNVSARVSNNQPDYIANDLLVVMQKIFNSEKYGVFINNSFKNFDIADKSSNLNFSRSWTFNYPAGGYKKRKVDMTDVTLNNSNGLYKGKIYTYSSNYANSRAVIMLPINKGTLYSNWYSVYANGGPLQINKTDFLGLETPRRLGDDDMLQGANLLVYDLLTEKVIDLYGVYNSFYTTGHDEQPVVTQII